MLLWLLVLLDLMLLELLLLLSLSFVFDSRMDKTSFGISNDERKPFGHNWIVQDVFEGNSCNT